MSLAYAERNCPPFSAPARFRVNAFFERQHLDEYLHASGRSLTSSDVALLWRYDELIAGRHCFPHCGACLESCPASLRIDDVLRHRMYFESYGDEKEAMRLYDASAQVAAYCGFTMWETWMRADVAEIALALGRHELAESAARAALEKAWGHGDRRISLLALVYLATIQAIAHGTRHIVDAMNAAGHRIDTLMATGGDAKNPVFVREHADATGCRIVLPRETEAVLLGSAILGCVASGDRATVLEAMGAMSAAGDVVAPSGADVRDYHERKHRVFQRMYEDQIAYREAMARL